MLPYQPPNIIISDSLFKIFKLLINSINLIFDVNWFLLIESNKSFPSFLSSLIIDKNFNKREKFIKAFKNHAYINIQIDFKGSRIVKLK